MEFFARASRREWYIRERREFGVKSDRDKERENENWTNSHAVGDLG